jgi:hypothetical protein
MKFALFTVAGMLISGSITFFFNLDTTPAILVGVACGFLSFTLYEAS